MTLTDRDRRILKALYERGPMLTAAIRDEFLSDDKKGSVTRKRLCGMKAAGLITSKLVVVGPKWDEKPSGSWKLTMVGVELVETTIQEGQPSLEQERELS